MQCFQCLHYTENPDAESDDAFPGICWWKPPLSDGARNVVKAHPNAGACRRFQKNWSDDGTNLSELVQAIQEHQKQGHKNSENVVNAIEQIDVS